jgi:hypothetical protein
MAAKPEIDAEMVRVISLWFEGKYMKRGIPNADQKILLRWRNVSTPPRMKYVFRVMLTKFDDSLGLSSIRKLKTMYLVKSANVVKSWTRKEHTAISFFNSNYAGDKRGKGKVGLILRAMFKKEQYITDVDTVIHLLKSIDPKLAKRIQVLYQNTQEIIMLMPEQKVDVLHVLSTR